MKLVIAPFLSVVLILATAETTQAQTTCKYPWSTYPTAGYCGGTAQIFRPQLRRAWLTADLSSSNVATRAAAVGWLIAEDMVLNGKTFSRTLADLTQSRRTFFLSNSALTGGFARCALKVLAPEDPRLDAYRYPVACAGYMDRL